MIDIHMHTLYSDGDKTVEEVLKMCEERGLEYISITDHDTCKQYNDEALKNNKIFSGKIIKGTELSTSLNKKGIEILAYNIDTEIIENWNSKYNSEEKLREKQHILYRRLLDICDKKGLIYDEKNMGIPERVSKFVEPIIYKELIKYKENYKILGKFAESMGEFFRKGLSNPDSSYFMNHAEFRPSAKEVTDMIHEAGGKTFLAHPFEYRMEDTIKFIDELRREADLDGIECFHPSAEEGNRRNILVEYARKNNLYISGGSDYHGTPKPDIEIGVGRGSLNIAKEFIEEWV